MLRESERKQMEEGFIQGKGTGLENFGSNLVNSHGFRSVKCSKNITSVSEMEMSLRVVSGGGCKGTVGTELGSW